MTAKVDVSMRLIQELRMKLYVNLVAIILFFFSMAAYPVDTDGDGSDDFEEGLAGTNINDPAIRPYWWKTIAGSAAGAYFGSSVTKAGDVNNDGCSDLIVGANGYATVLSGCDLSVLHIFSAEGVGYPAAAAGDVNNDGYDDVIIGSISNSVNGSYSGAAFVYSGANGSLLYSYRGTSAGIRLGGVVGSAGDINKDGHSDFIITAFNDSYNGDGSGSVFVYSGIDGSLIYLFHGDNAGDQFGCSFSASDINNDSYPDIVVGAWGDDDGGIDSGSARIFSGINGSVLHTFYGSNPGDQFGKSVSIAGDVNNDGYTDVVIGIPRNSTVAPGAGSVQIVSGFGWNIIHTFYGANANDWFGDSVSGIGDINNDSVPDILIGARLNDTNGANSGSATVMSGADGTVLYTFYGDSAGDWFGQYINTIGDIDNDTLPDFIISAINNDSGGTNSGRVRIYLAKDLLNDPDMNFITNTDSDSDDVVDYYDNCRQISNPSQHNVDNDVYGDACDLTIYGDIDSDSVDDLEDNCPGISNANQSDLDLDGNGDACDSDQGGQQSLMMPGMKIIANGGDVIVKVLDADAGYTSDLYLSYPETKFIATNRDVGTIVNLGAYPMGTELIFSIHVRNTGYDFYTGQSSRNPDGKLHAAAHIPVAGVSTIGFEDLYGGGDQDFNDNMFRFLGIGFLEDHDNDGISDYYDMDDDNDGMPDAWELENHLYPLDPDADNDPDEDGESNLVEYQNGTDPNVYEDMDDDGSVDDEENLAATDINNPAVRPYWWRTIIGLRDDRMAEIVRFAGDVNNDGYEDIIIAAPSSSVISNVAGKVKVISGKNGTTLYALYGAAPGDRFGFSVCGAGDTNADGYDDFIIAARLDYSDSYKGQVKVYSGYDASVIYNITGENNNDRLGTSVSAAGDINRDGYSDFVISDRSNGKGRVRVYSGLDASIIHTFIGGESSQYYGFGVDVSQAGDVNNDGYEDLIVGDPTDMTSNGSGSGSVSVFSGLDGTEIHHFTGRFYSDYFGVSVSSVGDINADGYDDILIGAPEYYSGIRQGAGYANIYSGVDGTLIYSINGLNTFDRFGDAVSKLGDIDLDGVPDFLIGAPQTFYSVSHGAGYAVVISGSRGQILYKFEGVSINGDFGVSVHGGGDLNNDGLPDVIIGSPGSLIDYGKAKGSARIILSVDLLADHDLDLVLNIIDVDDDNDGVLDINDAFPFDPAESLDTDLDGVGNNADTDDDNDQMPDAWESLYVGLDALVNDANNDLDGDGFTNLQEYQNGTNPIISNLDVVKNDLDADADSDLVFQDSSGNVSTWLLSNAVVASSAVLGTINPHTLKAVCDVDGDNDADLLFQNAGTGGVILWVMEAGGKQSETWLGALSGYTLSACGDTNKDGNSDLVFADIAGNFTVMTLNSNHSVLATNWLGQFSGWSFAALGDTDADSDKDIVMQTSGGDIGVITLENGNTQSASWLGQWSGGWTLVGSGDADNDNDDDLFISTPAGDIGIVKLQSGANAGSDWFGQWADTAVKAIGDIDNDGDSDIVFQSAAYDLDVIDIQAAQKSAARWLGQLPGYDIKGSEDSDGDGDADLVLQDTSGNVAIVVMEAGDKASLPWLGINNGTLDIFP